MAFLSARGQDASFRVVEERANGLTIEVNAAWNRSLKVTLDSLGATSLTSAVASAIAGGLFSDSDLLTLPSMALPDVQVVSSDFDEIALPAGDASPALRTSLAEPTAAAEALGVYRKRPTASLRVQLVQYDEDAQVLRRYRRVRIDVRYRDAAANARQVSAVRNAQVAVEQSVLADGTVYRIPITEEGIYKIDRAFLAGLGLNPATIEPNQIKIYGNGGAPVPALNAAPRAADLVENPVFVRGGGDGSFGDNDVLLFYGAAPSGWRINEETARWAHYVHPFSNENAYFLKVSSGDGQRVDAGAFPAYPDAERLDQVEGRLFVDFDDFNWSKQNGSGLTWLSSPISPTGRLDILSSVQAPGFAGGLVQYTAQVAIKSNPSAFAYFNAGSVRLAQALTGAVRPGEETPSALLTTVDFEQTLDAGAPLSLSMTLQPQSNSPEAALDWLRVFYPQRLTAENGRVRFVTPANQSGRFEFVLSGFSSEPQVWDVTDPAAIQRLAVQAEGSGYLAQIEVADGARPRELIAFVETVAEPLDAGAAVTVPTQNLHAEAASPRFLIITPALFKPYADELAARRSAQGIPTLVTQIEQIYNEFSGGLVDMRAARDYIRFLYDRAPTDGQRLQYVLFYGDGHYNYRGLGGERLENTNWIPPYEAEDSLVPDKSYTSDDYFGLLDPDEGLWPYDTFSSPAPRGAIVERVDIGIGRFPVQTEADAQNVLEKVKRYEDPETYGSWRSVYTFLADDGPTGLSGTQNDADLHLQNADVVAELVKDRYANVNVRKIYASSFQRVFRNGFKIPEARNEIINALKEGTLVVNYSGHGGEEGLAQESIFTREDAEALDNADRLAIFVTATCSFGWWDLAGFQSGAETLLLNPNGGAVALLTTVRLVYTSPDSTSLNVGLNRRLTQEMFQLDANGQPRRLGDILRITKNTTVGLQGNNRKFNLLGDPTMRIGIPGYQARVETVNGQPVDGQTVPLRALDRVTIDGTILDGAGQLDASFDGQVVLSVFDAERQVDIADQRWMPRPYYTVREDLLWRGQVQAKQGRYQAVFVVPKDISYSNAAGRISVYAASGTEQALGFTENVIVGGTSDNPPNDSRGPELSLFLNDTTFVSGGLTNASPQLIVRLFDESGINTVGAGVGHEMLLVINGDEANAVDIGNAFQSDENSYQRGTVTWNLTEQEQGFNTLSLRAWDVLNNSNTATLDYIVADEQDLVLRNVFTYPNPTAGLTRFVFEHNQAGNPLAKVQVRIYTVTGRLVRTLETEDLLGGGPFQLEWDGLDEDADPLAAGVYLYKLRVEMDREDGERHVSEQIEKLAIIR
ncbi:MAG: type IX secretion system sortase PorU [Rhodothermales bacterium]